ncbi:MAG TPA: response regulator [Caulifigura sp.]|jgi:two-component system KDP operon response regulator KdpE|nr:response regulator [Caulifigura sp.]
MTEDHRILIIEDDPAIRRVLKISLQAAGYHVLEATAAAQGIAAVGHDAPHVVILDLGLPDMDGLEVIRHLREWSQVPIIVLSARGQESDKVKALDRGANDYLTKPFGMQELMARVRAALRQAANSRTPATESVVEIRDLKIDFARQQVWVRGDEVRMTPTEYRLLAMLVRHRGEIVTHRRLLREVWGPDSQNENEYLRVYVGQLRRKIERDSARPDYIRTESGTGYRFLDETQ